MNVATCSSKIGCIKMLFDIYNLILDFCFSFTLQLEKCAFALIVGAIHMSISNFHIAIATLESNEM